MEKSWKVSSWGLLLALLLVGESTAASNPGEISTRDLLNIFSQTNLGTSRDPITYYGRKELQNFLNHRLSSFVATVISSGKAGGDERNQYLQQPFQTKMFQGQNRELNVSGTNYLAVFQGKNTSADVPLIILANYDTGDTEDNVVDDNGSGVVALIALAEHVSQQIVKGKLDLERTLIFALTDMAIGKYESGIPDSAMTGSEALVRQWLSRDFMSGRLKFGGAIVLDSIMNFNDEPKTQTQYDGLFSEAFPLAYQEMSKRDFRGDFLAMVYRDEELDAPLANAFRRGWRSSQAISSGSEVSIEAGLIPFTYTNSTFNAHAPSAVHFLHSEQAPFWNHFVPEIRRKLPTKELPALLLTDTEKYRRADCISSGCTVKTMVDDSPKNVEFLRRTVNALYATIKELQVDGYQNSGPRTESTSTSTLAIILVLALHRLFL